MEAAAGAAVPVAAEAVGLAVVVDSVGEVPVAAGNMKWSERLLQSGDAEKVSQAITKAEAATSGEIVPMIVRRSSTTGHVPFMLTLVILVSLLAFEVPQHSWFARYGLTWSLFFVSLFCFLISIPLSKIVLIQRLMVPQGDQIFQVEERALLEFYKTGIVDTKARTGILLFLSIMEKKAVVLADESIAKKLPPETWKQICDEMIHGIQLGKTADGLVTAIEKCGQILARHFPPTAENPNELKDHLIIKE
jgi:putative membrane protein